MTDQWQELKDTIIEIRDNNEFEHGDVTLMCQFLANYMEVLEKQMQEPCDIPLYKYCPQFGAKMIEPQERGDKE